MEMIARAIGDYAVPMEHRLGGTGPDTTPRLTKLDWSKTPLRTMEWDRVDATWSRALIYGGGNSMWNGLVRAVRSFVVTCSLNSWFNRGYSVDLKMPYRNNRHTCIQDNSPVHGEEIQTKIK